MMQKTPQKKISPVLVKVVVTSVVVVVDLMTSEEVMIVEVASGTKKVFVIVSNLVKVLVIMGADGIEVLQLVGLMVSVMTDLMYFSQWTNTGYTFGFLRVLENFFFEASRLTFLGTNPSS